MNNDRFPCWVVLLTLSHGVFQVFSNKTAWDPLCLEVRGKLVPSGVRVWQQQTNIPKDSDNCKSLPLASRVYALLTLLQGSASGTLPRSR